MNMLISVELVPVASDTPAPEHPLLDFLKHADDAYFETFKQLVSSIHSTEDLRTAIQPLLSPLSTDIKLPERLQYIQSVISTLLQDNALVEEIFALVNHIKTSPCTKFSEFIQNLKAHDEESQTNNEHAHHLTTYYLVEHLLYPRFYGDHQLILKTFKEAGYTARFILPPQYSPYDHIIETLKGTPFNNLFTQTWIYGVTFAPTSLGNLAASQLTSVSVFYRLIISLASVSGGFLRFLSKRHASLGFGRETALSLFAMSLTGLGGTFALVLSADLASVTTGSAPYIGLLLSNMVAGFGSAVFTVCTSDTAQTSTNDTKTAWLARMNLLGITPSNTEQSLASFARGTPSANIGKMGGLGSLAPSITLLLSTYLKPKIGNAGVYGLLSGLTTAGLIGAYFNMHPPVLDQLRHQQIDEVIARDMATYLGQPQLLSYPDVQTYKKSTRLDSNEWHEVFRGSMNYSGFGLYLADVATSSVILIRRGVPIDRVLPYTAAFSGISALARSLMGFFPRNSHPNITTNVSIAIMALSSFAFACAKNQSIWLSSYFITSIMSGIVSFSAFDELAQGLPKKMGTATGIAGAIGAISAVFFSIAYAFLSSTNKTDSNGQSSTANEYYLATTFLGACFLMNIAYKIQIKPQPVQKFEAQALDIEQPKPKQPAAARYRFYSTIIEEMPSVLPVTSTQDPKEEEKTRFEHK
jgi:hypothetical protein